MIRGSRGGYCYEQNLLFRTGLRALGFSVTGLSARVIRGLPAEAERPATHMALRVDLPDGAFLVDVGYGNQTPTAPLQMVPDVEQETPHEVMRLLPVDQDLVLQAKLHTGWQNVYRLAPHAVTDADYDVMNWFTATHPSSQFVTSMIVARPGADGVRHTMFNSLLSTRRAGELIDRKALPDAASHRLALAETFRLTLSDDDLAVAVTQVEKRGTRGSSHPFFT
jgi:N-hydroxyarylamine O-acetyltransferase